MVKGGDAQVTGEVAHTHGGRGGEQVACRYQRRNFRLKNGIVCDGLLQLDIINFTRQTDNSRCEVRQNARGRDSC